MDTQDRRAISRGYFTRERLAEHHFRSFNAFLETGMQEIVDEKETIETLGRRVASGQGRNYPGPRQTRRRLTPPAVAVGSVVLGSDRSRPRPNALFDAPSNPGFRATRSTPPPARR